LIEFKSRISRGVTLELSSQSKMSWLTPTFLIPSLWIRREKEEQQSSVCSSDFSILNSHREWWQRRSKFYRVILSKEISLWILWRKLIESKKANSKSTSRKTKSLMNKQFIMNIWFENLDQILTLPNFRLCIQRSILQNQIQIFKEKFLSRPLCFEKTKRTQLSRLINLFKWS